MVLWKSYLRVNRLRFQHLQTVLPPFEHRRVVIDVLHLHEYREIGGQGRSTHISGGNDQGVPLFGFIVEVPYQRQMAELRIDFEEFFVVVDDLVPYHAVRAGVFVFGVGRVQWYVDVDVFGHRNSYRAGLELRCVVVDVFDFDVYLQERPRMFNYNYRYFSNNCWYASVLSLHFIAWICILKCN